MMSSTFRWNHKEFPLNSGPGPMPPILLRPEYTDPDHIYLAFVDVIQPLLTVPMVSLFLMIIVMTIPQSKEHLDTLQL